jgi:hypothetical protein
MKKICIAMILCAVACAPSQAAESKPKVSQTFAEILTRVITRDKDSGAILRVQMKEDATSGHSRGELLFEMYEKPNTGSVVIQLRTQSMDLNVYEMYRLVIDQNMREELSKLKLMQEQGVEKAKKLQKEQSERIEKLTNGKLKYGMKREEVIAIFGQPKEQPLGPGLQQAGRFTMEYDDYYLDFLFTLRDIVEKKGDK